MDIGIVTIAYNGYGRFLPQWLDSIKRSTIPPKQVTIVLGKDHACPTPEDLLNHYPELFVLLVYADKIKPSMGRLRNIGIQNTNTEWIQFLSVDDELMADAIEHYIRPAKVADFLCIQWKTSGLGEPERTHKSPTPLEMYKNLSTGKAAGFLVAHSPFKRWLWENRPYVDNDYPNYPFFADCLEQGAVFTKVNHPCTLYNRRPDSHSRTVLVQRGEKQKALKAKWDWYRRIKRYYRGERRKNSRRIRREN